MRMKLKPHEKEVYLQSKCNKLLRDNGIQYYHAEAGRNPMLAKRRNHGYPDLFIFYEGKTIFIELKSKNGVVSATQKEKMSKLVLSGFNCHVANSLERFCHIIKLEYNIGLE